jgi:hypothetical protein
MGSGIDDWVYWHFFTITVDYKCSHIEFLLNNVWLTNLSVISNWSLLLLWFLYTPWIESESYVTTDGQPASLSWKKAPIWGLRSDLCYVWQLRVCWFGAPSLTRGRVCPLRLLLALASAVIFGSESRGTRDHILLSQIRDFPFRRLLRLTGLQWRYSTPPPHGLTAAGPRYITSTRTAKRTPLPTVSTLLCGHVA